MGKFLPSAGRLADVYGAPAGSRAAPAGHAERIAGEGVVVGEFLPLADPSPGDAEGVIANVYEQHVGLAAVVDELGAAAATLPVYGPIGVQADEIEPPVSALPADPQEAPRGFRARDALPRVFNHLFALRNRLQGEDAEPVDARAPDTQTKEGITRVDRWNRASCLGGASHAAPRGCASGTGTSCGLY